jgi:hypothetical protein
VWRLLVAAFTALYAAGRFEDWFVFPIVFAGVIAFIYKDRIMPALTEGTILLHALVGVFVCLYFEPLPLLGAPKEILILLTSLTILMLAVCITKVRLRFSLQVLLTCAFLLVSVYIGFQSSILVLSADTSLGGQFLLGFYGLQFVSYCLYILNFIPIPISKSQTFSERWRQVKQHASDLEQKYIDVDIHGMRTLGIIGVVCALFVFAQYSTDLVTGVTLALTAGSYIAAPHRFETESSAGTTGARS